MPKPAVTRFVRPVILFAVLFAAAWIASRETPPPVRASPAAQSQDVGEGSNRAAVAVKFEDGTVQTRCVAFSEDSIGGDELLTRSGLNPQMSSDGAVCSISGQGCPSENCSCRCPNFDDCQYWAFYRWEGGAWANSSFGVLPSSFDVANGTLHAWSWGPGDAASGAPAPDVTYDQICTASTSGTGGTATPTATPTSTATATATPTQDLPRTTPLAASPTATPRPIVTQGPRPLATVTRSQQGLMLTPAGSASPLPPRPLEGGVPLAPTAEPSPIVTPLPQSTSTPYQFSLPPTQTPRPRRVLSVGSGPTPTPLLLARAADVSGQAPAAKAGNGSAAGASGSEPLIQSAASARSFSPELLPGYAAYIVTIAAVLAIAWYALHRRHSRPLEAASESGGDEGPADGAAGTE